MTHVSYNQPDTFTIIIVLLYTACQYKGCHFYLNNNLSPANLLPHCKNLMFNNRGI